MDTIEFFLPFTAAATALIAAVLATAMSRRADKARRSQTLVEQIRLRETELRYFTELNLEEKQDLLEITQQSILALDDLDRDADVRRSPELRNKLANVRSSQLRALEVLLASPEDRREEADLSQLHRLSRERRADLGGLSEAKGQEQ